MKDKKYYVVKNMHMANALTFITGQIPFTYNSNVATDKKVWSFKNDAKFQEAIKELTELKNKLREELREEIRE